MTANPLTLETFGIRLERRASQLGLRPCDVGERARMHPRRVRRLMSGSLVNGPTLAEIETLARVLSCRPEWLAFGVVK